MGSRKRETETNERTREKSKKSSQQPSFFHMNPSENIQIWTFNLTYLLLK